MHCLDPFLVCSYCCSHLATKPPTLRTMKDVKGKILWMLSTQWSPKAELVKEAFRVLSDPTDTSSHSLGYRHRAVLQGLNWNPWERMEQLINLNLNNKVHRPRNTGKPALLHGVPKTGFQTTYGSRLVFIGLDLQINYRRLHNQLSRPQGINHCKRERERKVIHCWALNASAKNGKKCFD